MLFNEVVPTEFVEHFLNGQPDDVAPEAVKPIDKEFAMFLDAIGARLVQDIDQIAVLVDVHVGERAEADGGGGDPRAEDLVVFAECDSGEDLVGGSGEGPQHVFGVRQISWFAEDGLAFDHDGISGQHHLPRMTSCDFNRLGKRERLDIDRRQGDAIPGGFRSRGRIADKGDPGVFQKTPPSGRLGGQDEQKAKVKRLKVKG